MFKAFLIQIESRGWVDYCDPEADILDSYEDTHEWPIAEHVGETPEEAVEALFQAVGQKIADFGKWIAKGFMHETEAPYPTWENPTTRYALLVTNEKSDWWSIDEDAPELLAAVNERLGVEVA